MHTLESQSSDLLQPVPAGQSNPPPPDIPLSLRLAEGPLVRAVVEMVRLPNAPGESWVRFTMTPEVVAERFRGAVAALIAAAREAAISARESPEE